MIKHFKFKDSMMSIALIRIKSHSRIVFYIDEFEQCQWILSKPLNTFNNESIGCKFMNDLLDEIKEKLNENVNLCNIGSFCYNIASNINNNIIVYNDDKGA